MNGINFRVNRIASLIFLVMMSVFMIVWGCRIVSDIPVLTDNIPELSDAVEKAGDKNLPYGYVKVKIDALLGDYAVVRQYRGGSSDLYLLWLEDDSFITFEITEGVDKDILNKITEDTWAYVNGESEGLSEHTVEYYGKIQKLSEHAEKYFLRGAEQMGISESEYLLRRQVITRETNPKAGAQVDIFMFAGIVLVVVALLIKVLYDRKKAEKEANNISYKL